MRFSHCRWSAFGPGAVVEWSVDNGGNWWYCQLSGRYDCSRAQRPLHVGSKHPCRRSHNNQYSASLRGTSGDHGDRQHTIEAGPLTHTASQRVIVPALCPVCLSDHPEPLPPFDRCWPEGGDHPARERMALQVRRKTTPIDALQRGSDAGLACEPSQPHWATAGLGKNSFRSATTLAVRRRSPKCLHHHEFDEVPVSISECRFWE